MRNFLFIILLQASFFTVKAQLPTITQDDLFNIGDEFISHYDTAKITLSDTGGPNISWDFSGLKSYLTDTIRYVSINGTPKYNEYLNSTASRYSNYSQSYQYLTVNSTGYFANNYMTSWHLKTQSISGDFKFDTKYLPPVKMLSLPCTYGTTWNDTTVAEQTLIGVQKYDSVKYYLKLKRTNTCDAWGSLKTPLERYPISLRVRIIINLKETIQAYKNGYLIGSQKDSIEYTSFEWYVPNQGANVFGLNNSYYVSKGDQNSHFYNGTYSSRIVLTNLQDNFMKDINSTLYPNPASGEFYISGIDKILSIYNISGREVSYKIWQMSKEGFKVHLQDALPGIYIVKIIANNGLMNNIKLTISK